MLITDVRPGETDILAGHESDPFEIRSLQGKVLISIPATTPWTHEGLVEAVSQHRDLIDDAFGADYYLGTQWVGSTEV